MEGISVSYLSLFKRYLALVNEHYEYTFPFKFINLKSSFALLIDAVQTVPIRS